MSYSLPATKRASSEANKASSLPVQGRGSLTKAIPGRMPLNLSGPVSGASPAGGSSARTEKQLEEINRKLDEMRGDLKRIEETNAAAVARGAFAPTPPPASNTAPKSAPVAPGRKSPVPLTTTAAKPAPATKPHHLPSLPAPEAAPAPAPPKQTGMRSAAPTFDFGGPQVSLDDHEMMDSPSGSDSDDSSDSDDNVGILPVAAMMGAPNAAPPKIVAGPTPKPSSETSPRKGVGFNKPSAAQDGGAKEAPAGRAGRKGVGFGSIAAGAEKPKRERAGITMDAGDDDKGGKGRVCVAGSAELEGALAVDALNKQTRLQTQASQSRRTSFFSPIPRMKDILETSSLAEAYQVLLPSAPCSWLCCIALAVSYVTGVPTTIEKILRTNHMGAHYLTLSAVTLAELFDLTNDYLHTRFHKSCSYNADCAADEFDEDEDAPKFCSPEQLERLPHVNCEMATFDSEIVDPEEPTPEMCSMGEHPPITSLAEFRKELIENANQPHSLYIFHFDPYIIESNEARLRSNLAETEEEAEAILGSTHYTKQNKGSFGILQSFNPVQHTVTLLTPHLTTHQYPMEFDDVPADEENKPLTAAELETMMRPTFSYLAMEEHTVSMQVLYEATKKADGYSGLARGFVRVFVDRNFIPRVPSIFPLFVLDGSSAGGLMTSVLDVSIAPHILGLAITHHLAVTFLLTDNARRKQSSRNLLSKANVCDVKLRGIPLTKICQQLRLPVSIMVSQSDRSSIACAFVWYTLFLQQLQVEKDVRLGLVLPRRRNDAPDGMPNLMEEDFAAHLRLAISTKSVMLISFDVNMAVNINFTSRKEPAHFAIVIGFDEEKQIVRLADVNVKRFRKTWHVPFMRLYNAIMGYGYMIAAADKKTVKALNGKEFQDYALQRAEFFLAPPTNFVSRFEYPAQPYAVTVLADAVERLGFRADVERFLNFTGFHISYFLSRHMPLEGAAFVMQNYSHHALDDALSVVVKHYDYCEERLPKGEADPWSPANPLHKPRTEDDLRADIEDALANSDTRILIVKYNRHMIEADHTVFNGSSSGGSYGIVMELDARTNIVTIMNCNPSSFYRTFVVPLKLLFTCLCSWDPEDLRCRGTMLVTKERSQAHLYEDTKGFDFAHAMVHHPFRPTFSSACSCLALAATEMMMNIETPQLLLGAPLAVDEGDSKKKYKRYNNIFSAEDFLYALPSFSVHDWQTQASLEGDDMVEMANCAFARLKLPLRAVDITVAEDGTDVRSDPARMLEACNGISGLLTITLVAYSTDEMYGVPGVSVGLVNQVTEPGEGDEGGDEGDATGIVQLLEGDPCHYGQTIMRTGAELCKAATAVFLIQEVEEADEEGDS